MNTQVLDNYDYDASVYSVDEFTSMKFMDSVFDAAKAIPRKVFMNEQLREYDPIVELAYKLYLDNKGN